MKPTQETRADIFYAIWRQVPISHDDTLVDIGCGEGEAIQNWLEMGLDNFIIGIELDRAIYMKALERFRKQPQVLIVYGDASITPPHGTLYYLFNPFGGEQMAQFEDQMRNRGNQVRIVYNATQPAELNMFVPHWHIAPIIAKPDFLFRAALITGPK